ncbi:GNAT family N-acetyltransferase [Altererythrobacter xixiisoli]|uniref:GNAT family N-acetyltransferase n=1 Tax=Croceibacterium xixiisoli TaxID=1476466 RepID=A0A6I4TVX8_9SPHN|nr:GNAT family N-acetyltransferase [Croceibacterium xixiisoli]MXO98493.1 GNAT family N-acetyltransferase [Croceibacterium xixiisoli]
MPPARPLSFRTLSGEEIGAHLADLADLRITVFAAFPYLYDGSAEYEADYVREFAAEPGSVMIAAFDQDRIVGAATASPMAGQKPDIRGPFEQRGYDVGAMFYFGESVLLPEYRGQGAGHAFFGGREACARAAGARHACFASVIRPPDHPARPADYTPLDGFWGRRGYAPIPGLTTQMHWQDHAEAEETAKTMQYWLRALD